MALSGVLPVPPLHPDDWDSRHPFHHYATYSRPLRFATFRWTHVEMEEPVRRREAGEVHGPLRLSAINSAVRVASTVPRFLGPISSGPGRPLRG